MLDADLAPMLVKYSLNFVGTSNADGLGLASVTQEDRTGRGYAGMTSTYII